MENKQYTQTVCTDIFVKAILSMAWMFECMRDMVLHKKSFRIEIKYNAKAQSVEIETFAPKESLQDGNNQEY